MPEMMGAKCKTQRVAKGNHLSGDHGLRSGATHNKHTGIVDDAARATAIIEACGLEQEVFRLKAGEARVVLKEQSARVGQGEAGTLRNHRLVGEHHTMRRHTYALSSGWSRLN